MFFKSLSYSLLGAIFIFWFSGCIATDNSFTKVAPGPWRGVLELKKYQVPVASKDTIYILYDQFKEGDLPFNFEVVYTDPEHFYLEIINGSERIRCDSLGFGRNRRTARDTLTVWFPEYQSYLHAEVRGGAMQGEWVVTTKENYRIPFYAKAGQAHRFTPLKETPIADISGEWATLFGIDTDAPDKAIGEFKQNGNHLQGTFRTETGDYRFLEGTVQGRKFWMSCFDGAHAFLFSGTIHGDSLQGEFLSGVHHKSLWTAWRDPGFSLGHADSLTSLKSGASQISFSLPTPDGRTIAYPGAPVFDGKIKIFTIMGTWCPNCLDEGEFLKNYLKTNPDAAGELAVVGFAFERGRDTAQILSHLLQYKKQRNLPYELVFAGKAGVAEAERVFPSLSKVMAFPTMIIIDKNNRVRRIHTGFDGPATSKYAAFQQEFDQLIETLRKE
ncbi:MAG: TlpA family protein disulfide reductase [Saprospiraceae bacterium]|nr:TlpA family protein disulfide reductase [Saprospiraceae bacterium]